ncbi:oligosaccharide flippase family protein [Chitinimonas sp. PSY-7]|uniref:oligosaccharide flippase family protein n=1 Tax=Chitinimonas sp. PSY-7 TaxID=3459088 RepID=UPI00403FDB6E
MNSLQKRSKVFNVVAPILLGHFFRLLAGLFLIKSIAESLGVQGVGQLANLMMLTTLMLSFAAGGVSNAIAKYVAEYCDSSTLLASFFSTLFNYFIYFLLVATVFFLILSFLFKEIFFYSLSTTEIIISLLSSYFFTSIYAIGIGLLNGLKRYWLACISVVSGALTAILMTNELISNGGYRGAQFSVLFFSAVPVFPLVVVLIITKAWSILSTRGESKFEISRLVSFALMQCASVIAMPLADFIVRSYLLSISGIDLVGNWNGALRISAAYTSLFIAFFSAYFIPKFSSLEISLIKAHTWKMLQYISLLYIPMASLVYIFSELLIDLILSKDFELVAHNIGYVLLADYFKLMAYGICFVLISKAKSKVIICLEVLQMAIYIAVALSFSSYFGSEAVFLSLPIISFIYFFTTLAIFKMVIRSI